MASTAPPSPPTVRCLSPMCATRLPPLPSSIMSLKSTPATTPPSSTPQPPANADLYLDTNISATTGWSWFLRLCSAVTHPNCTANGPAMLCQANKANAAGPHPASVYNSSQSMYKITSTGISLILQDGQTCSSTYPFPRETTVQFVCSASATTAQLVSVTEVEECYYTAVVQTNLVCGVLGSSTGVAAVGDASSSGGTTPPAHNNAGVSAGASAVAVTGLLVVATALLL